MVALDACSDRTSWPSLLRLEDACLAASSEWKTNSTTSPSARPRSSWRALM